MEGIARSVYETYIEIHSDVHVYNVSFFERPCIRDAMAYTLIH